MFATKRKDAEHPISDTSLSFHGVTVRYNGHTALEHVSLDVQPGLRVAVVGPNGAGKSTLFNVIAGILMPNSGQVRVHGHAPAQYQCLAYVPQSSQLDWTFPINVGETVMLGRSARIGLMRWPGKRDRQVVSQSLEQVQLSDLAYRQVSELSGGQRQRMFIARALAQEAELILLDEPMAGLDLVSQEQIIRILDGLRSQGMTVLVATHDLEFAAKYFDRILLLNRKLIAYGSAADVLTTKNLETAYGGHMQVVETSEGKFMIGDIGGHHGHEGEGHHG